MSSNFLFFALCFSFQELLLLFVASLALLTSSGAQITAPYFFGKVIKASMEKGMCKYCFIN